VVIINSDFFKWITSKYGIFRKWQTQFPTLIFLLRKRGPILQRLLKNITILPQNRDYYLNKNLLFNIDLLPRISLIIRKDRVERDKALYRTSPHKGLVKLGSLFAPPEIHLSKYKSNSAFRTQQIFAKTSNMLITTRFERPWQSPSEIFSPLLELPHNNQEKNLFPIRNKSGTIGYKWIDKIRSKIIPSETKPALFYQSAHFFSNTDFSSQKSEIGKERYNPITTFKQPTMGSTGHPIPSGSTSTLHYINPLKNALDDLKKSVASIEIKTAEGETFIAKSRSDKSPISHKASDITHKMNINLNHLTNQVYQMLERKIKVEKERRGL